MSTVTPAGAVAGRRASLRNPLKLLVSAEPWLALVFMLLSFVLGVFWFVTLVPLIAVGFGLIVVALAGVVILAGTLIYWTLGARLERRRVRLLLGVPIRDPYRPLAPSSLPAWRRWLRYASDYHVWLDLLYLFLLFPIGIAELVIACVFTAFPVSLLTMPIYYRFGDSPELGPGWYIDTLPKALAVALLGIPVLLLTPYILVGVGRGHAWFARQLLGTNRERELEARVGQLTATRTRAVDASDSELRRIERDLHDGAQQRLVKLSMDLGMAREKLATDPAAAQALIAEAHEESKRAMREIRDLARGIHPAILTDRGLDPAISALAGNSPVPVTVDVQLDGRLPENVESTAYFIVAEALTNVARHSQATAAHVGARRDGDQLLLDITDNGVGGADLAQGTGLAGLSDRAAALDGTLSVSSPAGGGTRVHVELPLAAATSVNSTNAVS
jgi:signal transduction histidine kinase